MLTAPTAGAVEQEKNLALAVLLRPERDVVVGPGRVHQLTLVEDLVLATEPMQRLRRLRQMGLAHHGLPGAEHTRFSHSVGTAYWAVRMLEALPPVDRATLERMDRQLGPDVSLELIVRLFALVHDIALLPLGHTLRFQIGLFEGYGAFGDGLRDCLLRVDAECAEQLAGDRELEALRAHLALAAAVARAPRTLAGADPEPLTGAISPAQIVEALPALTFVYDLVHGVYAADLIDVCVRDMHAMGVAWEMPVGLLSAGAVFASRPADASWPVAAGGAGHGVEEIFRYGVRAVEDGRVDSTVLTDLLQVHQTRFAVAERGFYDRRKCAADAMLDKCLRRLEAADRGALARVLDPPALLRLGDDELLDLLIGLERNVSGAPSLAEDIRCGRIYAEVFALDAVSAPDAAESFRRLEAPSERTETDERLAEMVRGLDAIDVIVSVLPEEMQGKPANTLVGWHDGEVVPFDVLAARTGFPSAAPTLEDEYRKLRRLCVFVRRGHPATEDVAAACRRMFGGAA